MEARTTPEHHKGEEFRMSKIFHPEDLLMSRKLCRETDERNPPPRMLTRAEMDDMVAICATFALLASREEELAEITKDFALETDIRNVIHTYRTWMAELMGKMSKVQKKGLFGCINGCTVIVNQVRQLQGYTNVEIESLNALLKCALGYCSLQCTKSGKESRYCELRDALESLPQMHEVTKSDLTKEACPFQYTDIAVIEA